MNGWPNQHQILLLQAALFSGPRALEAWSHWVQQTNFDAIDHASYKLLPLIARNPDLQLIECSIFEKTKGAYRRTWVTNQILWTKMLPIFSQLLKIGVEKIVLLKGMAMILHYYKDFGARVIGDIDILIKRSDVCSAYTFLYTNGWKYNLARFDPKNKDHLNRWHALNFTHGSDLNLDLHWSFIQENCSLLDEFALKDSSILSLENIDLHVPNCTDLLLQACIHGIKHSKVPLIRWVADAMTLINDRREKINWDRFTQLAYEAHICVPLSFALKFLVENFEAPIPVETLQKLKTGPAMRLEFFEYKSNVYGFHRAAAWFRYCLNRNHLTLVKQIAALPQYLQLTGRLRSSYQTPFFLIYWFFKKLFQFIYSYRLCFPRLTNKREKI